jgi:ABC-type Fe3+-hydroxamate transport system substrate-binding protein
MFASTRSSASFFPTSRHSVLSSLADNRAASLWYGGVAFGVLAGAALSTFLWKRRLRALADQLSPLERAEQLIENCERKLESIEQSVADLKSSQS